MNKRTKRAVELRRKGLSFIKIGQELGIGSERARQIVRKYQRSSEINGRSVCVENKGIESPC